MSTVKWWTGSLHDGRVSRPSQVDGKFMTDFIRPGKPPAPRGRFSRLPGGPNGLKPLIVSDRGRCWSSLTGFLRLAALAFPMVSFIGSSAEPKLTSEQTQFFESKIRPLFAENCYKCHSKTSEKVKGGLLLDSKEGVLKGGDTGPAIIPGNPGKSLLLQAVRYKDKDLQMPPNDRKLADDQIADLESWVKMGAPDPRVAGAEEPSHYVLDQKKARQHWAYQRVAKPPIPTVEDGRHWVQTPVDSFILSKLLEKGLAPSAPADKVTLLRRASFDLTGLPPTAEEVDDFLADTSTNAFAAVVNRLLDSPRYGERWGRYWLDVAHYADTKGAVGQNTDARYLYSYTYRDWVIRSFNEDLPYDQFLIQQIAADKLALGEDKRPLAALGFLTLGNRFNNQINDIIDDRIDLIGKGTMAMTITCARCHDHKFDPIPSRDYYSLHGVFNSSTEPKEGPLLEAPADTPAYKDFVRELALREKGLDDFRDEVGKKLALDRVNKMGDYLLALYEYRYRTNDISQDAFMQKRGLNANLARAWEGSLKGWQKKHHPIFAPWFAFAELSPKEFHSKAKELAARLYANGDSAKPLNPMAARLFISPPASIGQVAARYEMLFASVEKQWQTVLDSHEARKKVASTAPPEPVALPDKNAEQVRQILFAKNSPTYLDEKRVNDLVNRDDRLRNRRNTLTRAVHDLKLSHPGSPARASALADADQPKDSPIFLRGNPGSKGPVAPRQFLEVLAGETRQPFKEGSGRLELAKAIASAENPLTARVMINRIWLHHFGEGLVRTPDDFGTRSEAPLHPQLLDYLAARFVEDGWSIKKAHRLIMLSSVYQQSSDDHPRFAQIDPENRYLWQMSRRRLDFEALRDTILFIGGKLDLSMGGPSARLNSEPYSRRRTVYGYVDRNELPNMFLAFDFANPDLPTGKRDTTIVPQQALFMMNNPLVVEQGRDLVRREDFKALTREEDRLQLLYKLIYQRGPTPIETKLALAYLTGEAGSSGAAADQFAWEFGYGQYDTDTKRVKQFTRMTAFAGNAWQLRSRRGGDPNAVVVSLTAEGGSPGKGWAAIRRWTAPRDGFISIESILAHQGNEGDGVYARIVSSQTGLLGNWLAWKNQTPIKIPRVLVKRGDAIDFVVDCRTNPKGDNFTWAPVIHMADESRTKVVEWNAQKDFIGELSEKRLGAWEKFAQVLLETNELTFVN